MAGPAVFFLLILYLLISIPVLIFWPGRGLNIRNMSLSVIPAMFGIILSTVFAAYIFPKKMDTPISFIVITLIIPAIFPILFIRKFGSTGYSLKISETLLFGKPGYVLMAYLLANLVGFTLASITISMFGGWKAIGFVMVSTILVIPVSLFFTILITAFTVKPSIKLAVIYSFIFGSVGFLFAVSTPDYLFFGLPVFVYTAVTPFLIIYCLIKLIPVNSNISVQ